MGPQAVEVFVKLKDLYRAKPSTSGPTTNGWHQIMPAMYCFMEYKLAQVVGARTPLLATPDPLAKGSLFHAGRATWFTLKFRSDAKSLALVRSAMETAREASTPPISSQAMRDAWSYMEQYVSHWAMRPLPKPVGVEYDLGPSWSKDAPWWLDRTARLDDVSVYPEAGNRLCIGECKTTSVGVDDAENEYSLNGQLLTQFLLWKLAPQGERKHGPVSHIMLDVIKKGYGNDKCVFARVPVQVTDTSLRWFTRTMEWWMQQTMRITPETWVPRNPKQCTRQIGRMRVVCQFRDLCKYGASAASKYVLKDGTSLSSAYASHEVKPWD